jgi:DNA polymerase-4
MTGLCRDCDRILRRLPDDGRCPACGSRRIVGHDELFDLAIAHIDCDAFYASIEKRDDPSLRDKPVVVGGGRRGVVAAACYVARLYGIRSAMPMFKALAACPDAVVIRPDMRKYAEVGRQVRGLMRELTPAVEPISIDEAFLDLTGTERLHRAPPAVMLNRLMRRIEAEIGVTASVGLSHNKFLAKVASDLDKPRGFSVIGRTETPDFLAGKPVGIIWGVGRALQAALARDGIRTIDQLQELPEAELVARYGSIGRRLARFSRGEDDRTVHDDRPAKSISAETTFDTDLGDFDRLRDRLWPLCEKVSGRMKRAGLAGRTVTLKLKTARFRLFTRRRQLPAPTQLAEEIYRAALPLLEEEAKGPEFRLIGVGLSDLSAATGDAIDLLDPQSLRRAKVERAIDSVRDRMGDEAIGKGRSLKRRPARSG